MSDISRAQKPTMFFAVLSASIIGFAGISATGRKKLMENNYDQSGGKLTMFTDR